ncbi:hypothetical protein H2204_004803 [Knufia peltigerae]|uniref:Uncharacterized protein n=1 Tax=Knufia peltigerae TaxID=1002370 RepID=A0AA38Y6I4_9EURO|nr:hypothetical protein H2204_004803 [Knufia peltigerae]
MVGYIQPRIFVHTSQKHADASAQTQRFIPESYAAPPRTESGAVSVSPKTTSSMVSSIISELEQSLGSVAFQSQCLDNFWSSLLPNSREFPKSASNYSTAGWTRIVQGLCERHSLVRLAVVANALSLLGDQSGQGFIVVQAWHVYGRSLEILARSLPAMNDTNGDELLATSILLAQYELLQGARSRHSAFSSGQRWNRHALGEKAILTARNPNSFTDGYSHQLLIDSRLHLTYPDLRHRKRSAFASLEWKTTPWLLKPKDAKNELIDVLVDIPAIMEDFDALTDSTPKKVDNQVSGHQQLEERCWILDAQLQRWSNTSGLTTVNFVTNEVSGEPQATTIPTSEDFAMAHLGLIYWTVCLLLYQHMYQLGKINPTGTDLPERVEPRQYCRRIALLLPYFAKSNLGEFFINMTAFPAITIARFLDRYDTPGQSSEERKLLQSAFGGTYKRRIDNFLGTWP